MLVTAVFTLQQPIFSDNNMKLYVNGVLMPVYGYVNNASNIYSANFFAGTDFAKFNIPSSEGLNLAIGSSSYKIYNLNSGNPTHEYSRFQGKMDEVAI